MSNAQFRLILASTALGVASCHPGNPTPTTNEQRAATVDAKPVGWQPLQSNEVKDAIHRALVTGETQRWQDGERSGYAVPSKTADKNGCRAVRYTVDQRPEIPFESITACEADRPEP